MNWMGLLRHGLLFVLVCFLATIVVAAYHEDRVGAILRTALRRTVVLSGGVIVLAAVMVLIEVVFLYNG